MKICLVNTAVATEPHGDLGTQVVEAAAAWRVAGHDVSLLTHAPRAEDRERLVRTEAFARIHYVEDVSRDPKAFRFGLARGASWFSALACASLRDLAPFDYIEFQDREATGYCSVLEQRLFSTFGDAVLGVRLHTTTRADLQQNRRSHALTPSLRETCVMEEHTLQHAELVLATSARALRGAPEPAASAHAHVVHPAARLGDAPTPPAPGRDAAELSLFFCGSLEPSSGIEELILAFHALPELSLDVAGIDSDRSPLGTSCADWLRRQLPANVRLSVSTTRDEVRERLRNADVCVLPATGRSWPQCAQDGLAAARLVIGGRDSGIAEMIEHGTSGLLVDGGDRQAIVTALRKDLAAAAPGIDRIAAAGAARIRALTSPSHFADRVAGLIDDTRRARRPRAARLGSARVSVLVPYYRESRAVLGQAIDSAIAQTHGDLQIAILNDGSPRDDAQDIVADMQRRDPRVEVHHKENTGLAHTRNAAIELATGDFILWLDADNVARPEYAATGLEVFSRFDDIAAITPHYQIFNDQIQNRHVIVNPLPFDRGLCLFRNDSGDAGSMFRAAVYKEHGLRYDPLVDCYSDWAMWMDCARAGLRVQPVPRVLYDYRTHADSMTNAHVWDYHLQLLGLLVERHLPPGDFEDDQQLLTTLIHGWGIGAILGAWGGKPDYYEQPVEVVKDLRGVRMRHRLADAIARFAHSVPGLPDLASRAIGAGFRVHGRFKDWRRGNRPT